MLDLFVRLALGGAVLVAALFALRWAQTRGMTARGGPQLRVVGRTGLTRTSLLAVVAVDDRRFLVGAGDHGVQLLSELDPVGEDATAGPGTAPAPDRLVDAEELLEPAPTVLPFPPRTHGPGALDDGPRTGPLDRLRAMTVRTHLREPVRALQPPR